MTEILDITEQYQLTYYCVLGTALPLMPISPAVLAFPCLSAAKSTTITVLHMNTVDDILVTPLVWFVPAIARTIASIILSWVVPM